MLESQERAGGFETRRYDAWRRGILRVILAAVAAGCCLLQACENSLLRNTVEAGLETVLEPPLPTETPDR
jgi:hypothetical protein